LVIFDRFWCSDIQSEKEHMAKRRSQDLHPFLGIFSLFGIFGNIVIGKGYWPLFRPFVCVNRRVGNVRKEMCVSTMRCKVNGLVHKVDLCDQMSV
jgi:hypothetical protein